LYDNKIYILQPYFESFSEKNWKNCQVTHNFQLKIPVNLMFPIKQKLNENEKLKNKEKYTNMIFEHSRDFLFFVCSAKYKFKILIIFQVFFFSSINIFFFIKP
jgi:hypothetical protein